MTCPNKSTICSIPADLKDFHGCQRSTCGIRLIYHRPAWTDGLHDIVSIYNPQGRPWHHQCLIQLRSWIFMFLPDNVMKAEAKVPLSICGWIWIKLLSSPSSVTDIFRAHDHKGSSEMHGHLQGDHPKWKYAHLNVKYDSYIQYFILRCLSLSGVSAGGTMSTSKHGTYQPGE